MVSDFGLGLGLVLIIVLVIDEHSCVAVGVYGGVE